jgi:hypothetical protein
MDEAASEKRRYVIQAGATYAGKQGPDYTPGISAESVASRALWLGSVVLPPGGRTKAHVHEHHESAFYMVSGDEAELWTGDQPSSLRARRIPLPSLNATTSNPSPSAWPPGWPAGGFCPEQDRR